LKLKEDFSVLNNQTLETSEHWNDSVQRRFYEQFINSLPKEFQSYINELDRLDKIFESAEHKINSL
ncbi:MAG: hypothetical protein WCH34_09630, partial [Bacteroidota bacterium]